MNDKTSRRDLLIGGLATTAVAAPSLATAQPAKFRIAIAGDFEDVALRAAPWNSLGDDVEVIAYNKPLTTTAQVVRAFRDVDAAVLMRERTPMPRAVIQQLPKLKLIVFSGLMNATLDHKAAADRNITVANALGFGNDNDPSAAEAGGGGPGELTMALLLACAWHIPQADAMIRDGGWAMQPEIPLKMPLAGRTLGIPGYGNIGTRVGKYAQAFGMKVLGFSRTLTEEQAKLDNVTKVDLDQCMSQSDVVSVHLPLTNETRGMIGARELGLMKPGVIFINTARGPIVDETAFVAALRSRRIAMAGVDVYDQEPLPQGHPFKKLPNIIMTPHIGYVSENDMVNRYKALFDAVAAYRKGELKPYKPGERDVSR
jgi:phosphoglycerate dehydrogenase-like enzyme